MDFQEVDEAVENFDREASVWNFSSNYEGASQAIRLWTELQTNALRSRLHNFFNPPDLTAVLSIATRAENADQFALMLIRGYLDEISVARPVAYGSDLDRSESKQTEENRREVTRVLESRGMLAPDALTEAWTRYFAISSGGERGRQEGGRSSMGETLTVLQESDNASSLAEGADEGEKEDEKTCLQGCLECLWERVGVPFFPAFSRALAYEFEKDISESILQCKTMRFLKINHDVLVVHRLVLRLVSWYCGKLDALVCEARGNVRQMLQEAKESSVFHLVVLRNMQKSLSVANKAAGCLELLQLCDDLEETSAAANIQVCRELSASATIFSNATLSEGQFEAFLTEVAAAASTSKALKFAQELIQKKEQMHGRLLIQLQLRLRPSAPRRGPARVRPDPNDEFPVRLPTAGEIASNEDVSHKPSVTPRQKTSRALSLKWEERSEPLPGKCPNGTPNCKNCALGFSEQCKLSVFLAECLACKRKKQVLYVLTWWKELEAESSFRWT